MIFKNKTQIDFAKLLIWGLQNVSVTTVWLEFLLKYSLHVRSFIYLYYTRGIAPKSATSGGVHLRSKAPSPHSYKETSQRWRVVSKGLLRYGSVRNYGTVRFCQKVRYGITYGIFRKSTVRKYGIIFSVPYTFRTLVMHALHFCFQVLHFSFLPITLPRQLRSPLIKQFQITITFCEKAKLFCHKYNSIVRS